MPSQFDSMDGFNLSQTWLTIGVFDGIHRGHQEIIRQLTAGAYANGSPAVLLTFHPHPALLLSGKTIPLLTTPAERAEILQQMGMDAVIALEFTRELADQSAETFMRRLKQKLDLKQLLVGHDFALGKNREGNSERLRQLGSELGYQVKLVEPLRQDGEIISSTLIRQAIARGDVRQAAGKLGRFYSLSGLVVPGDGRGRTIGLPTANIALPVEKMLPLNGVYAGRALIGGETRLAVINVGLRPTFNSSDLIPRVEAHLPDFSGDLYGQTLKLELLDFLREEKKFANVSELIAQIQSDIRSARDRFQQVPG